MHVAVPAGVEPATSWSSVGRASKWAIEAGYRFETITFPSLYQWPSRQSHLSYQALCRWLYSLQNMECQKDCMTLQQDLHTQAVWERKWGMEFHPQKCSVLTITRSTSPISHSYQLKRYVLEHQDTAKYLTVFLSWKNHIDRVCKKANSTLGFPRCNIRKLNFGHMRPTKVQVSLHIRTDWLDSSLW